MPIAVSKEKPVLRDKIILALREHSYRPTELFAKLQEAPGITESALKEALAELIDAGVIELSSDRHIRLRHQETVSFHAGR